MAEHSAVNRVVVGSTPTPRANSVCIICHKPINGAALDSEYGFMHLPECPPIKDDRPR